MRWELDITARCECCGNKHVSWYELIPCRFCHSRICTDCAWEKHPCTKVE